MLSALGALVASPSAQAATLGTTGVASANGSTATAETIPIGPDAPKNAAIEPGNKSLQISWSYPQADGGTPATEYTVALTPDDADVQTPPAITVPGDTFTVTVSSLVNGEGYDIAITAKTAAEQSEPAHVAGTPRTVPGRPSIRSVKPGDRSARVSWTPPLRDGGAALTGYVVTAKPSGETVTVGAGTTTARVAPLKNGESTRFTVTAVNAAGGGRPSEGSARVTPLSIARLKVKDQPRRRIVYGTGSNVRAALVTPGGEGIPGQVVELLAKSSRSHRWRRVASSVTNHRGRVSLRTTLDGSAALRLRHRGGGVITRSADVRRVVVAKRVSVTSGHEPKRLGMEVVVRGRVGPLQKVGSRVGLQRRVAGSWRRVALGRMVTKARYQIRWSPKRVGRYRLRVVKDGDPGHASGISSPWLQRVKPETAADVAHDILQNRRITLAKDHESGGGYLGSAEQNVIDVAHGRRARFSCHAGAPCGSTRISLRLLKALRDMGTRASLEVSEIAGGVHSGRSDHYSGLAMDITWVNGRHVGGGADYSMVVDRCHANGATQVFSPSYDPYGGHDDHVHCGWGKRND